MKYDLVMKNCTIPRGNQTICVDIGIKDEKIKAIASQKSQMTGKNSMDMEGMLVLPGCIDSHTHYMDPGFTHRETFETGTRSAAAGGVTTVIDMPCCSIPSVRDVDSLYHKLGHIAPQACVDFALWGGVTGEDVREGRLDNVQAQADEGVVAFKAYMTPSVPSYPRSSDGELLEIFRTVAKTGLPLGVHCENYDICSFYTEQIKNEGRLDGPAWADARCEIAEKVAIQLCIDYAKETNAHFHVVHMSTGVGAVLVEEAKKSGLLVTSETCPHYLTLNAKTAMERWGAYAKIAPPLRTAADNEILWNKLESGAVDFIATDHAPYEPAAEKEAEGMDIWTSFPGIPGTETMVPVMISEGYNKGRLSLKRLVEVLSTLPAIQYGLYPKKGCIQTGSDADFTIIDLNREWVVDKDKMYTKSKYTPFHKMTLKGKVAGTIVRGQIVYKDGEFTGRPGMGCFIKRQKMSQLKRTY